MLIRADAILEAPGKIHRPGQLRIRADIIQEVGSDLKPFVGEEILDFPGLTLTPGWINLHAHLELASLHGVLTPGKDFPIWLKQILGCLPGLTPEVRRESIFRSTQNALRNGTTSILSITSDIQAMAGLTSTASRVWWALEFMDLQNPPEVSPVLERAMAWLSRNPANAWHLALSPHAPYTASPQLYREIAGLSLRHKLPFTTHLAESPEETAMLGGKKSSFQDVLPKEFHRNDFQNSQSAVDWSNRNQVLPSGAILAHLNEFQPSDLPYLKEREATVVHCPTCHEWFGRKPFSFDLLKENKIPVCLGTDSPASSGNLSLDLRAEARLFREWHPHVSAHEAWEMITTTPAHALGSGLQLGTLKSGSWADWVGWRLPEPREDPIPQILESHDLAEVTCVAGKVVHHEQI